MDAEHEVTATSQGAPGSSSVTTWLRMQRTRLRLRLVRLGASVRARRLAGRPRGERLAVAGAVVLGVAAMVILFVVLLTGRKGDDWSTPLRALTGVVVVAGCSVGLAVCGAARVARTSVPDLGWAARLRTGGSRTAGAGLTTASLVPLGTTVALDLPQAALAQPAQQMALRVFLWCSFGVGVLVLHWRPTAPPPHGVDLQRLVRLLVPSGLLLVGVALATAMTGSLDAADVLLRLSVVVAAIGSVALVPAVLISSSLDGLLKTRSRGERLLEQTRRTPSLVVGVAVAKVVLVLVVVVVLAAVLDAGQPLLVTSGAAWASSVAAGIVMVALLVVDRRLVAAVSDHATMVRSSAIVVGVSLAVLVGLLAAALAVELVVKGPWTAAGFLVLVAWGWGAYRAMAWARLAVLGVGLVVAVLCAVVQSRQAALSSFGELAGSLLAIAVVLVLVVAGMTLLALVGAAVVRRRFGPLRYLLAVGVWIAVVWVAGTWGDHPTLLNVDLAVGAELLVAALLWATHRQTQIDGYEIVVTVVLTSALLVLPVVLTVLPDQVQAVLLVITMVSPGLAALWHDVSAVPDPLRHRRRVAAIGITVLTYSTLAGFVYSVGDDGGAVFDKLNTAIFTVVAIPVGLMMVASRSAALRGQGPPAFSR